MDVFQQLEDWAFLKVWLGAMDHGYGQKLINTQSHTLLNFLEFLYISQIRWNSYFLGEI